MQSGHKEKRRRYLKPKEVSELLDIPVGTLRYWRYAGIGLPWVKIEGSVRYNADDLDEYLRVNTRQPSVRAAQEANCVRV